LGRANIDEPKYIVLHDSSQFMYLKFVSKHHHTPTFIQRLF
jgi:hypothetical protein